jgi:hypothetical protein
MENTWFCASMDIEELPRGIQYPNLATPISIVKKYIERFTLPGQMVLDPFAGYGSTLIASEELGRGCIGIEIDKSRYAFSQKHLQNKNSILLGDARKIREYDIPQIDLCFTGPPFFGSETLMKIEGMDCLGSSYDEFLNTISDIFSVVGSKLSNGGYIITLFQNLIVPKNFESPGSPAHLLPIAWDAARLIDKICPLVKEEIWCITAGKGHAPFAGGHGYFHIFRK